MAGADRMTIEEVVRKVLRDEHADVIRESVAGGRAGADGGRGVSELIGAEHGERSRRIARRIATAIGRGGGTRGLGRSSCRSPSSARAATSRSFLQPRKRSEQALVSVVQQAYVCGVSTRRVDQLVESLGLRISQAARSAGSPGCSTSRSRRSASGRWRAATRICSSTRRSRRSATAAACSASAS